MFPADRRGGERALPLAGLLGNYRIKEKKV